MQGNKRVFAAVGALVFAVGGAAYFYYVYLPQQQDEAAIQKATKPTLPANPPATKGLAAASAVVTTPKPEPALATQPKAAVTTAAPEPIKEPAAEPVKPASSVRKSAAKKPEAVKMSEPMDSQSEAPVMSREVLQQAPTVLPEPAPAMAFAPDTESRVIRPKYNDVMTAVLRSDKDAVKQLLDLGWWVDKPGADGFTPLVAAVMNRDTQMVQLLLDHGAVPSSQALKLARERKDTETASLLEQRGAR